MYKAYAADTACVSSPNQHVVTKRTGYGMVACFNSWQRLLCFNITWRRSFQPSFWSKGLRTIPIIATIATSAAPPWMGVLMAARVPWLTFARSLDLMSGSLRYLC